jgi:hypothetical protein
MSVRWYYMDPTPTAVELTDRIWTPLDVTSSAEELNAVQSALVVEDPDADLILWAWRRIYAVEDDAPEGQTVIWMGFIAGIEIKRSEVYVRNATARAWHLTLTDLNYLPSYPLFDAGDSPSRSEETDLERVAWYLTTQEALHFADNTDYIDVSGGIEMDEDDLLSKSPYDLLRSAMDVSGRNAFILYDESVGPPDFDASEGELALFYATPDATFWTSDIVISNDAADIDPAGGVYPPLEEHNDFTLDPSLIYWKLHAAYDGGTVPVHDDAIATNYTARETTVYLPRIKTEARAEAAAERMLAERSVPAVVIDWGYQCKPEHVNALMAGQSFHRRATHLANLGDLGIPDFSQSAGVLVRAMDRHVIQVGPDTFNVSGTAVPVAEVSTTPSIVQYKYIPSVLAKQIPLDDPPTPGHTLVMMVAERDHAAGADQPDDPALGGWTEIAKANTEAAGLFYRGAGMWYRVVTGDETGVTSDGDGQTYECGANGDRGFIVEIDGTYAGVFDTRDAVASTNAINCGGAVSPPSSAPHLVIGVAATKGDGGAITEDDGVTAWVDQLTNANAPRVWMGYRQTASTDAVTVGGTMSVSDVFCGITAVFG